MAGVNQSVDVKAVLAFLKQFTAGLTGHLQVETISPVMVKGGKPVLKRETVALDNIDSLAEFIEKYKDWNLYFRPNLLKSPQGSGEGGAAVKDDIIAGTCFHVDCDPVDPPEGASVDEKRQHLHKERERILRELREFPVPPSFIVDSGGGYQCFWLLEVPVSVAEVEAINQRLCDYFDTPDACWSCQHLMRLPFTVNWPGHKKLEKGRTVAPSLLLEQNAFTYSMDDFAFLPAATKRTTKGKAATGANVDSAGLPERFEELLAGDEDLRRRWEGDTTDLLDPSRNGLDMSLTSLLVKRGFNDAEITDIHKAFPHGKVVQDGREGAYITDMLVKARSNRILSRTEPWFTAHRLIAEWFTTDDGTRLLRYWNGDAYAWCDGAYRMREKADMAAKVWDYLGSARQSVGKKKTTSFGVNRARSGDVLGALEAAAHLDSSSNVMPCWLDGASGDDPKDLLVMTNGILHMPTRTLSTHNPRLFSTTILPFAYEPDAGPPKEWLRFMNDLFGDDVESIETLQEIFGYMLTCDTSQQKIFMVVGPKRAGKGVIARILRALIGAMNYIGPTLASLSTNFGLEPFIGKRLVVYSDVRISGHIDQKTLVERLLAISGEDTLSIPRKYKPDWTGALKARQIMFTNELPKLLDDGALASRFIILHLMNSFLGREDTKLTERLLKELPAILNWSLVGLDRLNERGAFRQPASGMELIKELERLCSPISAFIEDKCVVSPEAQVGCDQLYNVYELYCHQEGWQRAPTKASFGVSLHAALPKLEHKKVGPRGNQHWFYKGIGLATGTTTAEDFAAGIAEVVDLDAVRAKNRALLI